MYIRASENNKKYKKLRSLKIIRNIRNRDLAEIISIFISGLLLGITGYSVFTAFGPAAKELRDPFEEHED